MTRIPSILRDKFWTCDIVCGVELAANSKIPLRFFLILILLGFSCAEVGAVHILRVIALAGSTA